MTIQISTTEPALTPPGYRWVESHQVYEVIRDPSGQELTVGPPRGHHGPWWILLPVEAKETGGGGAGCPVKPDVPPPALTGAEAK